ncbi:serine hydrolase [Aeromonas bivalvium]|uniref:serine hydrolase n=1 Tax=Aeromonas bivalvium TaxID=440079 RepID=UPI0038D22CDE
MMLPSLARMLLGALLLPVSLGAFATPFLNPPSAQPAQQKGFLERRDDPTLSSAAFVIANPRTGEILSERNGNRVMPIASITKLMTALVVLDANQRMNDMITVSKADIDRIKGTGSRLAIGSRLSRAEMLHISLMASENRAASSLARYYPGGQRAFIAAMNAKARMLGMWHTRFADSTGLNPRNVSTAHDLAKLVAAASAYPLIRQYTSAQQHYVRTGKRQLHYRNSNRLVHDANWQVLVSKTGYIREAGRCLVMEARINREPMIMVLLNADTSGARVADAQRVRSWLESSNRTTLARTTVFNKQ